MSENSNPPVQPTTAAVIPVVSAPLLLQKPPQLKAEANREDFLSFKKSWRSYKLGGGTSALFHGLETLDAEYLHDVHLEMY